MNLPQILTISEALRSLQDHCDFIVRSNVPAMPETVAGMSALLTYCIDEVERMEARLGGRTSDADLPADVISLRRWLKDKTSIPPHDGGSAA